jgi:putative glutamine amidotransferase
MPGGQPHQYSGKIPRNGIAHEVRVEPGSRIEEIVCAPTARVNSFHHQGLRQVAHGLRPTAWSPDGVVEAVELQEYPFGLAVQWHPEWLQDDPAMRGLFRALVEASEKRG